MASHTVLSTPFLPGATASIYTRGATVLPLEAPVPPGSTLIGTAPVASGGTVTATGVAEGQRYWAVGQDSSAAWRWVAFRVDEPVNPQIAVAPFGKLRREKTEQLVGSGGGGGGGTLGYLSLKDEGCALDGVSNDAGPFLAAVSKAAAEGKQLVHPGGDLYLGTQIAGRHTFQLRGVDPELATITQGDTATNHHMFDLGGYGSSTTNTQALTADATQGSRTIAVASAAGYAPGDVLIVQSTQLWPWSDKVDTNRGELVTVESKASNTLTLRAPLDDNYPVSASASARKLLIVDGFLLEGVTLRNPTPAGHTNGFLRLRAFRRPTIRDVITRGADNFNFLLNCCDDFTVDGVRMLDGNDNATAGRYVYGVAAYGATRDGRVSNAYMRGGRHLFTTLGGDATEGIPRHITVAHCEGTMMTNACFDSHPEGEFIHHIDCHAHNTKAWGMAIRSPNSDATHCTVRENVGAAFWLRVDGARLSGCTSRWARTGVIVSTAGDAGGTYEGQGVRISDGPMIQPDLCTVSDQVVDDPACDGFYIGDASDRHQINHAIVRRPGRSGSAPNCFRFAGTSSGHRVRGAQMDNAGVGVFGVNTVTDVEITDPTFNGVTSRLAGTMVPRVVMEGAGTPAGAIQAAVGSTYRRTDGGAGTTFYVKESGVDASGWAGK